MRALEDLKQSPLNTIGMAIPPLGWWGLAYMLPSWVDGPSVWQKILVVVGILWPFFYLIWRGIHWEEKLNGDTILRLEGEVAALNKRLEKKIKLVFDKNDPDCFDKYNDANAKYVHVYTHNISPFDIPNCLVEVRRVEAQGPTGNKIKTPWHVSLPVSWCILPDKLDERKYQPITLPAEREPRYAVDLVSGYVLEPKDKFNGYDLLRLHVHPKQVVHRDFCYPGTYRFLMHLHSTDSVPDYLWLIVHWTGNAMEMEVDTESAGY